MWQKKKNDKHGSAQGNKEAVFKESEGAACPEYFTEILGSQVWGNRGGVFVKISVRSLKDMVKVQNMGKGMLPLPPTDII